LSCKVCRCEQDAAIRSRQAVFYHNGCLAINPDREARKCGFALYCSWLAFGMMGVGSVGWAGFSRDDDESIIIICHRNAITSYALEFASLPQCVMKDSCFYFRLT
jgi:hypothetical protein